MIDEADLISLVDRDLKGWQHEDIVFYIAKLLNVISTFDPITRDSLIADIKEMREDDDE